MFTPHLSDSLTETRHIVWIIIAGIVILVFSGAVQTALLPSSSQLPKSIPVFGVEPDQWFFPKARARWRNTLGLKTALASMYKSQKHTYTILPVLGLGDLVFLPIQETQWLADQPNLAVNAHELLADFLETDYTIPGSKLAHDSLHVHLISTKLTREVGNLIPIMYDETRCSVDELWGLDSDKWKEIDAMPTVQHMIAQVVGRVFFGAPLCRNQRLQDSSLAFTQDVPLSAMLLRLTWRPLRPILAPILTISNRIHLAQFYGILKTELARRLSLYDLRQEGHEANIEEPNDFLQWSIQQAKMLDDPQHSQPYALARRLMIVNFSSIHTSSLVIMNALNDITKNPEHIDELVREIIEVLAHHGGCWSRGAVADMTKLDSAMRESQRLNNGNFITVVRKVVQPDGITTPTGLHLPYGTILGVPGYGMHHDEDIYPNPNDYNPFRFSEIGDGQSEKSSGRRTRHSWVTTSPEYTPFGHGRYACPGRFFASTELKILLAYLIFNYDILPLAPPPQNLWRVASQVAGLKPRFRVRRKKSR
ncbi:ent-kaurene oxidase [Fusarium pseudocircinatum]|uniref:Ent-kaurene oxidase n=1 Tax=Fusarium pseudocircinatum TaxID=56676 RepID=A0A8H5KF41_9HYPO|nr:ent-kaurene oxidase [Fusarium pseudocircinatum]